MPAFRLVVDLGRVGLDASTTAKLALTIAGTLGAIDTAVQGKSGDALITAASAVERVAEGVETTAIAAAGTDTTKLAAVADTYTGQHLTDAITLAATQLPSSTSPASMALLPETTSVVAGKSVAGSAGVRGTGVLAGDSTASDGTLSVSAVDHGTLG
jgi:hypothetical protein